MSDIVTPGQDVGDSRCRPWCRLCGLDYKHSKFGGKVVQANAPGQNGKDEIIFCTKCSGKPEAQEIYDEIMAIKPKETSLIEPVRTPRIIQVKH